jgi:hypothetical protein
MASQKAPFFQGNALPSIADISFGMPWPVVRQDLFGQLLWGFDVPHVVSSVLLFITPLFGYY